MDKFIETLTENAKKNAKELNDMSYDEAYNYVLDTLSFAPLNFGEGIVQGVYPSQERFVEDRMKFAYALCQVIAKEKIGIDPSKIGVVKLGTNDKKPDEKLDDHFWECLKISEGGWLSSEQNATETGFLGFLTLGERAFFGDYNVRRKFIQPSNNRAKTFGFARMICHELGHAKQNYENRFFNEHDLKIRKETDAYLNSIDGTRAGRIYHTIAHDAMGIEKDADEFSIEVMHGLLKAAVKKNGKTPNTSAAARYMARFSASSNFSHNLSEKFYPKVREKAIAFNNGLSDQGEQVK